MKFSNHLAEDERAGHFNCDVAVCALCHFLKVPRVGLQSVIETFPGHTDLPYHQIHKINIRIYHECEGRIKDRRFASRDLPSDDKW